MTSSPSHQHFRHLSLKEKPLSDLPREKLEKNGRNSLTISELIAVIIGSGTRNETAIQLADRILFSFNYNLLALRKSSVNDLCQFDGIGRAKAISILAALELGKRQAGITLHERPIIKNSDDAERIIRPLMEDLVHEEFWIILLNQRNQVIATRQISVGGLNKTLADARIIFKHALNMNAISLILCHNHPSGNLTPSKADIELTQKFNEASKLLDLRLLDHLIISRTGYYSFADNEIL